MPLFQHWIFLSFFFLLLLHHVACTKIIRTIAGIPPFGGDGKLAINANLNYPSSIYYSSETGETYIADCKNHVIRKVDNYGIISTIAGTPGVNGYSGDGGFATDAQLNNPKTIFVTPQMDMYIADTFNCAIRKVDANGIISTIIGTKGCGSDGDYNLAQNAQLNFPMCVVVYHNQIYICDTGNHAIRKIDTNGYIFTVVGILGQYGYSGDNHFATNALLYMNHMDYD